MVTFLMTEIRLNAKFKFYHAGLREAQKIYFYPFLSTRWALFYLYAVNASITQCSREDKRPIREKMGYLISLEKHTREAGKHDCLNDCNCYLKRLP